MTIHLSIKVFTTFFHLKAFPCFSAKKGGEKTAMLQGPTGVLSQQQQHRHNAKKVSSNPSNLETKVH